MFGKMSRIINSAINESVAVGRRVGSEILAVARAAEFEKYRRNAWAGIMRLKLDLQAAERWPHLPHDLALRLNALPCHADPRMQRLHQDTVIMQYYRDLDPNKQLQKGMPTVSQGKPGDIERAIAAEARRARMLQDLEWMTKNPIGAGSYGFGRQIGNDHDTAIAGARVAQGTFDIVTGPGNAHRIYDRNVRSKLANAPPPPGLESRVTGIPRVAPP
jgi:hypothetical protein